MHGITERIQGYSSGYVPLAMTLKSLALPHIQPMGPDKWMNPAPSSQSAYEYFVREVVGVSVHLPRTTDSVATLQRDLSA